MFKELLKRNKQNLNVRPSGARCMTSDRQEWTWASLAICNLIIKLASSSNVICVGSLIGRGAHPAEHGTLAQRSSGLLMVCLGSPADICALGNGEGRSHGWAVQISWKRGWFCSHAANSPGFKYSLSLKCTVVPDGVATFSQFRGSKFPNKQSPLSTL